MSPVPMLRYQAVRARGSGRVRLGELGLNALGELSLISAPPEWHRLLDQLVQAINEKPQLLVPMHPPADAPPMAQYTRGVSRYDPLFFDALQAFMTKHYGVFLAPEGPIDEVPLPDTELPLAR